MKITNVAEFKAAMAALGKKEDMRSLKEDVHVAKQAMSRLLEKQGQFNKIGIEIGAQGEIDLSLEPETHQVATGFHAYGNHGPWIESGSRQARKPVMFGKVKLGLSCKGHFFELYEQDFHFFEGNSQSGYEGIMVGDMEDKLDAILDFAKFLSGHDLLNIAKGG